MSRLAMTPFVALGFFIVIIESAFAQAPVDICGTGGCAGAPTLSDNLLIADDPGPEAPAPVEICDILPEGCDQSDEGQSASIEFSPESAPSPLCYVDPKSCSESLSNHAQELIIPTSQLAESTNINLTSHDDIVGPSSICYIDPLACSDEVRQILNENFPSSYLTESSDSFSITDQIQSPSPICLVDPKACTEKPVDPDDAPANSPSYSPESIDDSQAPSDGISPRTKSDNVPNLEGSSFFVDEKADESTKSRIQTQHLCNASNDRPSELWRELLLRRKENITCSRSASAVLELRSNDGTSSVYRKFMRGETGDGADFIRPALEKYRDECLFPFEDHNGNLLNEVLPEQVSTSIEDSIGVLRVPGANHHCSAGVIEQDDKKLLVTAAHCIGKKKPYGRSQDLQIGFVFQTLEFETLSGKIFPVEVHGSMRGRRFNQYNDYVILQAKEQKNIDLPVGLPLAEAVDIWNPLYIVGVHPVLWALRENSRDSDYASEKLQGISTLSLGSLCRVHGLVKGKILHNCQTERGMSGSLILIEEGKEVKVAGIHTGEVGAGSDDCGDESIRGINQGIHLVLE